MVQYNYAYVRFRDDNVKTIVETSLIDKFDASTHLESDIYKVKWEGRMDENSMEVDDDEGEKFRAQILLLAETREEIENKIKSGSRIRIPIILDSSVSESDMEEDTHLPPPTKKRAAPQPKKNEEASKAASLKKIMAEKIKKRASNSIVANSGPSGSHDAGPSKHVAGPSETATTKLVAEIASLRRELADDRQSHVEYQDKMLERFDRLEATLRGNNLPKENRPPSEDHPSTSRNIQPEDANGQQHRYHPVDGQVSLGQDIQIATAKFDTIMSQQKNSLFVKNLAVAIWGSDILRTRSITGKGSNRYKGKPVCEPLEPEKVQALRECFLYRLRKQSLSEEERSKEAGKVNFYLSQKIMDLRRT